ncbi:hypothetical protein AAZX31_13G282300 [Glycine max]|uniref:Uncharacterized protein n=1 Tax=Glycine max TaxID=3847 RepID=I1M3V7_SOYBN|nr:uncharacterized protein LOC102667967 [Glycine max]KAG4972024.1 hypothetical protein JHK85_038445 [Glycine max]KAG4978413.1 hypothetical protein JHK86_037887 [Glycine max]KAH1104076.1 hypothetical protein GYH30_037813 [Glycine max]KAH1218685.1 hypothetical protein GmHk_13G039005 [Glycine max]KRH22428.1 hypothetical protein GLYMA_13G299800v4 [Glycine max]|eukprot:XP_006595451.1 uncharacterized protein LOC102667967 [Glycine max]
MGCCFSTPNSKPPQNGDKHQQPHLGSHEQNCRIRIRQSVEEESVKEVLSETPISKPQQVPTLMPQTKTQLPVIQPQKVPIRKALDLEEVSLVLETCSNGESFSTTTTATTVTENREDEATSKRSNGTRNRKRSYAVDGRDRRPKSPARKPEIPARSRPLRGRESDHVRRHSGEGTVRQSRSPSRGGRSQLRPPGGISRRVPPAKAKGVVEENDTVSVKESLENPHVSLECFIFL